MKFQSVYRDSVKPEKLRSPRDRPVSFVRIPSLIKPHGFTPASNHKANTQVLRHHQLATEEDHIKLDELVDSSQKVLFTASAVFPFDFFPDHISIEPLQVNFVKKSFFATYHVQTIPIKNIADVFLQTSLLFASIKIVDASYIENSIIVEYLRKKDACRARRIIQGLVLAMKNNIDLSTFNAKELAIKAEQLGEAREIDLMD